MTAHLDAATLDELRDAPASDPRREHLRDCARCRAMMRAHDDFVESRAVPAGARLAEAERALSAFIEREIGPASLPVRGRPRVSIWDRLLAPAARPAWALAAFALLAGGALIVTRARAPEPVVLRGAPPVAPGAELELLPQEKTGDAVTLRWRPAREADAYLVRLYSVELDEIGTLGPLGSPSATIRPRDVAPGVKPGGTVLSRVVALTRGDEIGASALGTLEVR